MLYFTTANFNLFLLLLERREGTRQRTPEVKVSPQIKLSHARQNRTDRTRFGFKNTVDVNFETIEITIALSVTMFNAFMFINH